MDPIFYYNDQEVDPPLEVKHVVMDASQLTVLPENGLGHRPELTKVEFQNTDNDESRMTEIGDRGFHFCASLHSIFRMPSTLQRIGQASFYLCSTLGFVHLPDGIQVIGEGAFESCISLLTVRIPSSVRSIERATFRDCRQLRSIELPPTLESVGGAAFFGCLELVNIYLPESVNILGENLFVGCIKLELLAQSSNDEDENNRNDVIIMGLRDRYRQLPIHKWCYYQSYSSLEENLDDLKDMVTSQFYNFEEHVDGLGMSPFHILSLSAEPNAKLAEALTNKIVKENMAIDRLRRGCLGILQCRFCWSTTDYYSEPEQEHVPRLLADVHGHGALFFACLNIAPGSTEMIKYMFRLNASRELAEFGLKRWRDEVYHLIDRELENDMGNDNNATTINTMDEDTNMDYQNRLRKIELMSHHVARYRLKEKLSILELGVWKAALLSFEVRVSAASRTSKSSVHRETVRTLCGADVIISNVLLLTPEGMMDE